MVHKSVFHDFLTLAKARKTTYEFTDQSIKKSDLLKILEAARWSPSCSNIQPWRFVVVKDKKRISQLIEISLYSVFHTYPTLIICLVLNSELWEKSDHRCVKNNKVGMVDALLSIAMPALSICFEAVDLGIDSCMLTPETKNTSRILRLRKGDAVPIIIGLGYEKKGAFQKPRERKELKEIVYGEFLGRKINL